MQRIPRSGRDWLFSLAVVAIAIALARVIYYTPFEAVQGPAQKIFYLHLPAALDAFMAFGIVALAGIGYLWLGDPQPRSRGRELGGGRRGVHDGGARDGPAVGAPDVGNLVDVGRAPHAHALSLVHLRRLSGAARRDRGSCAARALLGGARNSRLATNSVHSSERLPVSHAASAPDRDQAERAVAAAGDADDADHLRSLAFTLFYLALVRQRYRLATERDLLELEEGR